MTRDPGAGSVYVVDTNVWIDLVPFRPSVFPTLWERIQGLADDGRLLIPEEVIRELLPSQQHTCEWLRQRPELMRPTADSWDVAREVADRFPQLVNLAKPRGSADPFVAALGIEETARQGGMLFGNDVVVVTNERSHLPGRAAIPDACDAFGIDWVDMYGWFEREGWEF